MSTKEATIDCDILPGACGAKTSFTRKIGACPRCRIKKIEVSDEVNILMFDELVWANEVPG